MFEVKPTDPDICCTANCSCQEYRPDSVLPNASLVINDDKKVQVKPVFHTSMENVK
jgi:hypothetical protein